MVEQKDKKSNSINKQAFGLIIGLCVEFILGMTTNIFVSFPEHLSEKQNWEFAKNQIPIILHLIIGILLFLGSISLLVQALRLNAKQWIILGGIGAVVLLGTVITGSLFVGSQTDNYSFMMAIGFIVSLFVYIWGIYKKYPVKAK